MYQQRFFLLHNEIVPINGPIEMREQGKKGANKDIEWWSVVMGDLFIYSATRPYVEQLLADIAVAMNNGDAVVDLRPVIDKIDNGLLIEEELYVGSSEYRGRVVPTDDDDFLMVLG